MKRKKKKKRIVRDADQEQLVREAEQVEMQLAAGSEAIAIRSRPTN